ncbi:ECF transporter S component [Georgenia faecalis]|uniref:ECF transporter S component n=2 Tax=Georgenia faecalis TaxID=2483799 RepID=A0ABV9D9V5_9MICO|nr:ECF transporter S component [Georgenia faecalis]
MPLSASIKRDFTLMAILLVPVAIAVNVVGGQLAKSLQLWVFLDSIGTFIVAMLAGPWIGLVTGALSVLILALADPTMAPWAILAGAMGFLVGMLARRGMFTSVPRAAVSALIVTVLSVAVSVLISYFLYGGFTTSGVSILTGAINDYSDLPLFAAVVASHVPAELIDKFLSVGIAYVVVRSLSNRALLRFPQGEVFLAARKKATRRPTATPA